MKFALLALAVFSLASPQAAQEPTKEPTKATFTEQYAGIMFDYPSDWTITRKERDRTHFAIPIPGSTEPAELQVVHTEFHADKDLFQMVQVRINEQLKREVVRQWEQEILGVPLLFTRINYTDKNGLAKSTLTGLYYTRTQQKVLLRLECRESDYDTVSYVFLQAMETLRTVDGTAPLPDDPTVKFENSTKKPVPVLPPPKILDSEAGHGKTAKPTGSAAVDVSARKVNVLFPDGWSQEKVEGDKLTLANGDMSKSVTLEVFSTLDSDPAKRTLYKASSASLDRYLKVDSRNDTEDVKNDTGALVSTTWRIGKTADGNLATFYAVVSAGDFYFLLTYEQTDMGLYKNERKLLDALVKNMTIEPAP